jgi:alcohol dehydrogenase class IV
MTSNAVIIDAERQVKEVIIDPNIIPDIAVDDASVMLDIPPSVTAATGMDALTHAIEAFVSVGAHPLTDANALEAIRLINLWLPKAVDDGITSRRASKWRLASIWRAWHLTAPVWAGPCAGASAGATHNAARRMQRHPAADHRKL